MDEVLSQFEPSACALHGHDPFLVTQPRDTWEITGVLGVSIPEFWEPINNAGSEFWISLEPHRWMHTILQMCLTHSKRVVVLTTPSKHSSSYVGKIEWLDKYLPGQEFQFSTDKSLLAKPGRVLIDDSPKNCSEFKKHGGSSIVFPAWGNHKHREIGNMDYIEEQIRNVSV